MNLPPSTARRPARRWITVFDRMVANETLGTMVAVLSVLVLIIVSKRFLKILALAIDGEVSGHAIFVLLGLKITGAAINLLPPAAFVAVLMTLGRLYRDSEMPVLAAAGVGVARIYRAVMLLIAPLTVAAWLLAWQVLPWSDAITRQLFASEERMANIRGIKEGKFAESNHGQTVFYVEEQSDHGQMRNLFVQSNQHGHEGVVISSSGQLKPLENGEQILVLNRGVRYDGKPGNAEFLITEFEEYGVRIRTPEANHEKAADRAALTTEELLKSGKPKDIAEVQKRLSIPLGVLFLSGLAVPLARLAPRSGVYGNLFAAFLIYLGYENLQRVTQGLVISSKIPHALGYSLVYIVTLFVILALLIHSLGGRWLITCLNPKVWR